MSVSPNWRGPDGHMPSVAGRPKWLMHHPVTRRPVATEEVAARGVVLLEEPSDDISLLLPSTTGAARVGSPNYYRRYARDIGRRSNARGSGLGHCRALSLGRAKQTKQNPRLDEIDRIHRPPTLPGSRRHATVRSV